MKKEGVQTNAFKRRSRWWRGAWGVLILVLSFKLVLVLLLKAGVGGEKQTRGWDMHVPAGQIEQQLLSPRSLQEPKRDEAVSD